MEFYVRIYRIEREVMAAICDQEIHGKTFEDDGIVLHIKKDFYGNELKGPEEVSAALKDATIANLVGENAVALAINEGAITPENVIQVEGVPHAQMVKM